MSDVFLPEYDRYQNGSTDTAVLRPEHHPSFQYYSTSLVAFAGPPYKLDSATTPHPLTRSLILLSGAS